MFYLNKNTKAVTLVMFTVQLWLLSWLGEFPLRKIVWVPRVHQLWMPGRVEVLLKVAEMWSFPILLFSGLVVFFLLFF